MTVRELGLTVIFVRFIQWLHCGNLGGINTIAMFILPFSDFVDPNCFGNL